MANLFSDILDVKYFILLPQAEYVGAPYDNIQWAAVLKSVSAHDMYRKIFHRITPKQMADFLMFDAEFPRSIRHCLATALSSLHKITGKPQGTAIHRAEKILGRLQADLDYTDIDEVLASGMHEYLDSLQDRLNQVEEEISATFFRHTPLENAAFTQQWTKLNWANHTIHVPRPADLHGGVVVGVYYGKALHREV